MAGVTGPIITLPGDTRTPPKGMMCDTHPEILAVIRVQGETDSFGSEQEDMCQECYDNYVAARATADTSGYCDWCKKFSPVLHPRRDIDEGMSGPVYDVCNPCIRRQNREAAAELAEYESDYPFDD